MRRITLDITDLREHRQPPDPSGLPYDRFGTVDFTATDGSGPVRCVGVQALWVDADATASERVRHVLTTCFGEGDYHPEEYRIISVVPIAELADCHWGGLLVIHVSDRVGRLLPHEAPDLNRLYSMSHPE